jgi:hypothetical protein
MSFLIGIDFYGKEVFSSPTPPIREIKYVEAKNSIVDEIHVRERTDGLVDVTSTKQDWQPDSILLPMFKGDYEAGNLNNGGIPITEFAVKRRKSGDTKNLTLAHMPFVNNEQLVYEDYLQTNDDYIYSIVPVGVNGLEGRPNEATVKSDFVGFYLLNKNDLTNIIPFDKFMDSGSPMVNMQLNQGRTEIKTMTRFPTVFYDDTNYHSFTLESVFLPNENERSNKAYERILELVNKHEPVLLKGSDGTLMIVDISNVRRNVVQNSWEGNDYFVLQVDCVEISDLESYIEL